MILNQEHLQTFIDFLPDLEENEVFYLALRARKKYGSPQVCLILTHSKTII